MGFKPPAEAGIQRAIIDTLEFLGCVVIRVNGGLARYGDRAVRFNKATVGTCADLIVFADDGVAAVLEVKRPGGRATPDQLAFLESVRRNGHRAEVVHSVDEALKAVGLNPDPT